MSNPSVDADFNDKVAIVTGAGSGLGAAIARTIVQRGGRVLLADVNGDAATALAHDLDPSGDRAIGLAVDVTKADQVAAAVALAGERLGPVELAVNNAGVGQKPVSLAKLEEAEWRRVIDVNLNSVFLCMQQEIRAMLAHGRGGAIVNTASALGTIASPAAVSYVASKHAVVGLTKAAALEYASRNIRINAVAPGVIDTPLVQGALNKATRDQMIGVHPIGRLGEAQEVAELVCFLLSGKASFITGSTHLVDGGWTAQ